MSNITRPTTLAGIKRLAKTIKKEHSLQHSRALDLASIQAGYENFAHARKILSKGLSDSYKPQYHVEISVIWRDKQTRKTGSEILEMSLHSLDLTKLRSDRLQASNVLHQFSISERCRLVNVSYLKDSQQAARSKACAAARTLMFMDATGLMPARAYRRVLPRVNVTRIPGKDHTHCWYDQKTKRYLMTDEPYEASVKHKEDERREWAEYYNIDLIKAHWPGMYNPGGGCRLYLMSHKEKGIPLGPVIDKINVLPEPLDERKWSGRTELFK